MATRADSVTENHCGLISSVLSSSVMRMTKMGEIEIVLSGIVGPFITTKDVDQVGEACVVAREE